MELNSFLDNALSHCNEENVRTLPVMKLPRPAKTYKIRFYLHDNTTESGTTSLRTFVHNIVIPDPLHATDITTLKDERERNNLVARWQKFVNFTLKEILTKAGLNDATSSDLLPTVHVVSDEEAKRKDALAQVQAAVAEESKGRSPRGHMRALPSLLEQRI